MGPDPGHVDEMAAARSGFLGFRHVELQSPARPIPRRRRKTQGRPAGWYPPPRRRVTTSWGPGYTPVSPVRPAFGGPARRMCGRCARNGRLEFESRAARGAGSNVETIGEESRRPFRRATSLDVRARPACRQSGAGCQLPGRTPASEWAGARSPRSLTRSELASRVGFHDHRGQSTEETPIPVGP